MYVFDNAAPQASARLGALAEVFDPGTIRHLDARGTTQGWRCLEVGGGLGTITGWLSRRVGAHGTVLTTDIDTRHLERLRLPNVAIRRHDVVEDDLPSDTFDLAYTRLVLSHVTDSQRALANVIRAVRPGGWVLVEDFEVTPGADAAMVRDGEPITRTAVAMRHVVSAAGANMRLGRSLPQRLRAAGLEDVAAEGRVFLWRGGSPGAAVMRLNFEQLRDAILATGLVTAGEYADDLARLDDEDFEVRSPILWSVWGRRPAS
jgi:SAM-dependent methyltransferase